MQPALMIYDDDKMLCWAIGVQGMAVTEPVVQDPVSISDQSRY